MDKKIRNEMEQHAHVSRYVSHQLEKICDDFALKDHDREYFFTEKHPGSMFDYQNRRSDDEDHDREPMLVTMYDLHQNCVGK